MSKPRLTLCVALLVGLGFSLPAEARFGKRSRSNDSEARSDDRDDGAEHEASSVGRGRSGRGVYIQPNYYSPRPRYYWYPRSYFYLGHHHHAPYDDGPPPAPRQAPEASTGIRLVALGELMAFSGGGAASVAAALEGERFGFSARYDQLVLRPDDGTPGYDLIGLANLHFTYAFVATERFRLRLEVGADTALAPDLTAIAPGIGLSTQLWIAGPLLLEGSLLTAPFPYRKVDGQLGLALALGPVALRGGWRTLVLDDAGLVDGVRNVDLFGGPYVGVGIVF